MYGRFMGVYNMGVYGVLRGCVMDGYVVCIRVCFMWASFVGVLCVCYVGVWYGCGICA